MDTYPQRIECKALNDADADFLFMLSHKIEQKNRKSDGSTAHTVSGPNNRGLQYLGTTHKADGTPVMFFSYR